MTAVKFRKRGAAAYLAHMDVQRAIMRTLNRAGIKTEFSKGFNPHMQLYLSAPIPLGVESGAEYFCAYTTPTDAGEFLEKYNRVCVSGLEAVKAAAVEKNPNFAAVADCAVYEFTCKCGRSAEFARAATDALERCRAERKLIAVKIKNGIAAEADVFDRIIDIRVTEGKLTAVLTAANGALRPEVFAAAFFAGTKYASGTNAYKTGMCHMDGGRIADIDVLFFDE
ncbi:MAG: TIGR03936 family radical SAM-associated protein [Firmicutes bacterium]|nr:TIGR03936 family radical SAM-associated protein [Bacillota bacterium]